MKDKWQKLGISALICPIFHIAAFKAENALFCINFLDYSLAWNVLNYPSGVLPITKVLSNE
jgi:hypothetical protein